MKRRGPRWIIGTTDRIDIPGFSMENIRCKTDTGAETSALHCSHVKLVSAGDKETIQFRLLDPSHPQYKRKIFKTTNFKTRQIKSSNGISEERYVITTKIVIFGHTFETEFTLADREHMNFPILLGKRLLKNGFLVDVTQKDLSFQDKEERQQNEKSTNP